MEMSSQDPTADQLSNPFKSRTANPTFPQCIWDILRDHPAGMTIANILKQLQSDGLKDLSGLKKPNGQVANNLARHPEHFQHVGGNNRLWGLTALQTQPSTSGSTLESADEAVAEQSAAPEESRPEDHATGTQKAAPVRLRSAITRRSTRSSSPAVKLADSELVGLRCTIWWEGEDKWFSGIVEAWDPVTSNFTVQYADGDREQGMRFVKYEIDMDSTNAQIVTVHDYKAGNYLAQAAQPEESGVIPGDSTVQSAGGQGAPTNPAAQSAGDDTTPCEPAARAARGAAGPVDAPMTAAAAIATQQDEATPGGSSGDEKDHAKLSAQSAEGGAAAGLSQKPGTDDSSEEDMSLSALAGRHSLSTQPTSATHPPLSQAQSQRQPQAAAENQAEAQAQAQAPKMAAPQKVTRACKADQPDLVSHEPNTAAMPAAPPSVPPPSLLATAATAATARQGSPEPAPPPAVVELRTTRSRSRRMSMDASPSVTTSGRTHGSAKGKAEGRAALSRPSVGRNRSATPAYPPASPAASPAPAAAASMAGDAQQAPVVSNKKPKSGSAEGASKQAAAPRRRSQRLSTAGAQATTDAPSQLPSQPPLAQPEAETEPTDAAAGAASDTAAPVAAALAEADNAAADGVAEAASNGAGECSSSLSHLEHQAVPSTQAVAGPPQKGGALSASQAQAPSGEAAPAAQVPTAAETAAAADNPAAGTDQQTIDAAAADVVVKPVNTVQGNADASIDRVAERQVGTGGDARFDTAEQATAGDTQLAVADAVAIARGSHGAPSMPHLAAPAAAEAMHQLMAPADAVLSDLAVADPAEVKAVTTPSSGAAASEAVSAPAAAGLEPPGAAASAEAAPEPAVSEAAGLAEPAAATKVVIAAQAAVTDDTGTSLAVTASKAAAADNRTTPAAAATPALPTSTAVVKPAVRVKPSGTTRIGLPIRSGLMGKGGLGGLGPSGGSTHIRSGLNRGLQSALPSQANPSEAKQSNSAGSGGQKRKREPSSTVVSAEQGPSAKARSGGSRQTSSLSKGSAVSPDDVTGPSQVHSDAVRQHTAKSASPPVPASVSPPVHPSPGPTFPQSQPQSYTQPQHDQLQLQSQVQQDAHSPLPSPPEDQPQSHSPPNVVQTAARLQGYVPAVVSKQMLAELTAPQLHHQQQHNVVAHAELCRKRVPLHQGVGLVKLCLPDYAATAPHDDSQSTQQRSALRMLVAKYADWPFGCLWPESPASQPPPLPSRSPSPTSLSKTDPFPLIPAQKALPSQPRHTYAGETLPGQTPQPPAVESDAGLPMNHAMPPSVARMEAAHRSSGNQAPKRVLDPLVARSALDRAYGKRSRDAEPLSGQLGGRRRDDAQPGSATKSTTRADSAGKAALSNDGAPSSKAGSTPQKSTANRHSRDPSPQRVTSSHPTHPDPHPSHARDQSRDHSREYDRDRGHGNRESHRRQQDDRESGRDQLRGRDYDKGGDFRRGRDYNMRRSSTSSSSRTSSASRERYRRRSRYNSSQRDSRSRYSSDRQRDGGNQRQDYRQSQSQSYKGSDRGRHQDRHYSDDQTRTSRQTRDRDSRSRYDGGRSKDVGTSGSYRSRSASQQQGGGRPQRQRRGSSTSSSSRSRSRSHDGRRGGDPQGQGRNSSPTGASRSSSPSGSGPANSDLPEGFRNGRIFWSSDRTFKECLDKKLFATKDPKDIDNMNENTAVFLWNCFQREMHGVWVSTDQGHLEPRAFGGKFKHQARVKEKHMFAKPLPTERVLHVLPRKPHMPGTTFEQHLDRDSVCQLWDAFVQHNKR